jgi:Cu(I)/Ag(I) efflux system membrane fusion protein
MHLFKSTLLAGLVGLLGPMAACDKKNPEAPAGANDGATAAAPAAPTAAPTGDAAIVQGYDDVRAALADDDLARTKTLATALKSAVAAAGPEAAPMTAGLDAIVAAAEIEAARDAFGTFSEAYIKFLGARPALKEGLVAFRCPMARGYKKWVQRDQKMMNPYMGKAMLECGGPTDLVP